MQVKQSRQHAADSASRDDHYTSSLDVIRKIVEADGLQGLYAGLNSSLIGVGSTNFVYFYWYSAVRSLYLSARKLDKPPNTAVELSLGAIAGAIAQIFTIPVAVITTRQQTQLTNHRQSLLETGREIVSSEDGWTGLWRGLKASLVLVINPAITYGAYERLRLLFFQDKATLRSWESFGKQDDDAAIDAVEKLTRGQPSARQPKHWRRSYLSLSLWPKSACNRDHRRPGMVSHLLPLVKS